VIFAIDIGANCTTTFFNEENEEIINRKEIGKILGILIKTKF